jgi:hypothetical protein
MTYWAIIVMILAAIGAAMNIYLGTPFERILHDIMLFLISIGMLMRIRYKTKQAERDKAIKEE